MSDRTAPLPPSSIVRIDRTLTPDAAAKSRNDHPRRSRSARSRSDCPEAISGHSIGAGRSDLGRATPAPYPRRSRPQSVSFSFTISI